MTDYRIYLCQKCNSCKLLNKCPQCGTNRLPLIHAEPLLIIPRKESCDLVRLTSVLESLRE